MSFHDKVISRKEAIPDNKLIRIRLRLIRVIIKSGCKLFLKFVCFRKHVPESDRSIHFEMLFKIFGLMLRISQAKLMTATGV